MPDLWDVLIADDDRAVAVAHHALIVMDARYRVAAIAGTAEQSLRLVDALRPDLLLLDLGLPGASGLRLLRSLRARGVDIEAIVLTADRSASSIRTALHLGVVDYLIKPFTPARFRGALRRFEARAMFGCSPEDLDQSQADLLTDAAGHLARPLPKEITEERLNAVRAGLLASPAGLTAQELARRIHASRATAYRYLEYLRTERELTVDEISDGPGRPRRTYRLDGLTSRPARPVPARSPASARRA